MNYNFIAFVAFDCLRGQALGSTSPSLFLSPITHAASTSALPATSHRTTRPPLLPPFPLAKATNTAASSLIPHLQPSSSSTAPSHYKASRRALPFPFVHSIPSHNPQSPSLPLSSPESTTLINAGHPYTSSLISTQPSSNPYFSSSPHHRDSTLFPSTADAFPIPVKRQAKALVDHSSPPSAGFPRVAPTSQKSSPSLKPCVAAIQGSPPTLQPKLHSTVSSILLAPDPHPTTTTALPLKLSNLAGAYLPAQHRILASSLFQI